MMQDQKLTELTWRQYYHVHHRMVLVKVDMLEHSIKSIRFTTILLYRIDTGSYFAKQNDWNKISMDYQSLAEKHV